MTIDDLIAALEKATGPSRELDAEIARQLGWVCLDLRRPLRREGWMIPDGTTATLPKFSASLDTALTLVWEDWTWDADASAPERGIDWRLHPPIEEERRSVEGTHRLAPIALCIAALKARKK